MLKISRTNTFEAAHRLPNVPPSHKCHRMHGHSYRVTIYVTGGVEASLDWIVDTAQLDHIWAAIFKDIDHHTLNDIPGLENPTTEILAMWIWSRVNPCLSGMPNITSVGVEVQETERSTCYYDGP